MPRQTRSALKKNRTVHGAVLYYSRTAAVPCAVTLDLSAVAGRTEFSRRERHIAEDTARIGRIVGDALLVGHAIFGCMNQILCGSDKANYREQTKGNRKVSAIFIVIAQYLPEIRANALGNIAGAAATAAAILHVLDDLYAEHYGINDFNNCLGHVSFPADGHGACTEIIRTLARLENADVAFATVQHDVLFQHRNALEFLGSTANTSLQHELDIEADGYSIKPTVELYRFNAHVSPADLGTLYTHVGGMLNDLLTKIGQINAYVFKAIAIPAGIQNSVGFDTNSFLGVTGIACKSVFRHSNTSVV